jgi:hypothetical protein
MKTTLREMYDLHSYTSTDMNESSDSDYQDNENILTERPKEDRMAHIQYETLQMLVSFQTLFRKTSLKPAADT